MISHRHGCIFIEVPKTGSTSIRQVIGQPPKPHLDIRQIRAQLLREGNGEPVRDGWRGMLARRRQGARCFRTYFKFGFVRNPWDRTVSLYRRREGLRMSETMTFDEFVDWIQHSSDTCLHPRRHRNQLDWFTDRFGRIAVDFIGRFERLESDWRRICERLGIDAPLPSANHNPSKSGHYSEYYTARTRDVIARKFRVDIEYFEYEFDGSRPGGRRDAA